ncbi:MAG: hypothetical protein HOH13_05480 [Crocinitomicaceae bacterium]|nr:hypothetical protein [Crocinitomicaceae bacterium]
MKSSGVLIFLIPITSFGQERITFIGDVEYDFQFKSEMSTTDTSKAKDKPLPDFLEEKIMKKTTLPVLLEQTAPKGTLGICPRVEFSCQNLPHVC